MIQQVQVALAVDILGHSPLMMQGYRVLDMQKGKLTIQQVRESLAVDMIDHSPLMMQEGRLLLLETMLDQ